MKNRLYFLFLFASVLSACSGGKQSNEAKKTLFKHVTLIDGTGKKPLEDVDILIQGDTIANVSANQSAGDAEVIDLTGKTIMPALISTHVHVGNLKGTETKAENYTRENVLNQLKKYESYGLENLLVMGTDRPMLFESGLRDSSMNGLVPGARMHSAGYGFGVPEGAPPLNFAMDQVYRPVKVSDVPKQMDSLARLKPAIVKLWLDDFGGKFKKMDPAIYKTIIQEAHKHNLRVAAHVYYLADARQLIADGVDVLGHSIRDLPIDDALLQQMKAKNVVYIPTLSLDEYAFIYARKADWIDDEFFKKSLEPGVYEMITSPKYQEDLRNSPAYAKNVAAFDMALKNLKRIYDAGILVSLGTDSGAMPLRAQGFSEHLELELMVQAGLTPLQAISIATKNAAEVLKISNRFGTIEQGKIADFIVLDSNPVNQIKNTRKKHGL